MAIGADAFIISGETIQLRIVQTLYRVAEEVSLIKKMTKLIFRKYAFRNVLSVVCEGVITQAGVSMPGKVRN